MTAAAKELDRQLTADQVEQTRTEQQRLDDQFAEDAEQYFRTRTDAARIKMGRSGSAAGLSPAQVAEYVRDLERDAEGRAKAKLLGGLSLAAGCIGPISRAATHDLLVAHARQHREFCDRLRDERGHVEKLARYLRGAADALQDNTGDPADAGRHAAACRECAAEAKAAEGVAKWAALAGVIRHGFRAKNCGASGLDRLIADAAAELAKVDIAGWVRSLAERAPGIPHQRFFPVPY